jgi:hypothetical protein
MIPGLSSLTVNRSFITEFIAADKSCCASGMVEVEDQHCEFLDLRPEPMIPPGVTDLGFNLGHTLFGTDTYEVIHFAFEFYGFQTFNVLINPNTAIAQAVLKRMIETGDYFFFAIDDLNNMTDYRGYFGSVHFSNSVRAISATLKIVIDNGLFEGCLKSILTGYQSTR